MVWCLWITQMKTLDKIRASVPWSCHREKWNGSGNREQVTCSVSCRRLNTRSPKIADVHTSLWKMETIPKSKVSARDRIDAAEAAQAVNGAGSSFHSNPLAKHLPLWPRSQTQTPLRLVKFSAKQSLIRENSCRTLPAWSPLSPEVGEK